MEPSDLKSPPPDDTCLETWLRTEATLTPLPDDGFSARVVAALPAPAPRPRQRAWLCVASAAIGFAVAAANGAFLPGSLAALPQWEQTAIQFGALLTDPMLLLALGTSGLSALYALKSDDLRQLF